jgi:hypothetical protein
MYGRTTEGIFEGADISSPGQSGPSIGFRNSILKRVGELSRRFQ